MNFWNGKKWGSDSGIMHMSVYNDGFYPITVISLIISLSWNTFPFCLSSRFFSSCYFPGCETSLFRSRDIQQIMYSCDSNFAEAFDYIRAVTVKLTCCWTTHKITNKTDGTTIIGKVRTHLNHSTKYTKFKKEFVRRRIDRKFWFRLSCRHDRLPAAIMTGCQLPP